MTNKTLLELKSELAYMDEKIANAVANDRVEEAAALRARKRQLPHMICDVNSRMKACEADLATLEKKQIEKKHAFESINAEVTKMNATAAEIQASLKLKSPDFLSKREAVSSVQLAIQRKHAEIVRLKG